ncbi:hypothetical protein PROFUN_15151 [Planoprotostelium fungivorum]|uniref:Ras guanine nucleotide exchange factor n=1 Tax=Planoprotostelium fungivorum TaxID=1890364 RepID=A0A2P6MXR3_9EUKA|nr:hypothetical protein PROFUN_15151 [Planoprotostelium fungivorum]
MDEVKKEKGIKCGTMPVLMDYLVDHNTDANTVDCFLAAFTAFTTADEIWSILENKYRHYRSNNIPPGKAKVLGFLWEWINQDLHRDFLARVKKSSSVFLYDELLRFIASFEDKETINKWKLHILKSAAARASRKERKVRLRTSDNLDMNNLSLSSNSGPIGGSAPIRRPTPNVLSAPLPAPPKRITMTLSTTTYNPISPTSSGSLLTEPSMSNIFGAVASEKVYEMNKVTFADIEPADAAKQLTLLESGIFQKINHTEFHHLNWKKEDGKKISPHILNLVDRFNTVSYWVSTEIVIQSELKERVNVLRKFIIIAEHLRDLGNYNGVMEIIAGLNSFVITRLQSTWAQTPQRYVTSFNDLNQLMESRSNYRDYRLHMRDRKLPVVPYLGVILRDVLFIEEGNKNYVGDSKEGIFNFEKIQLLGEVLSNVRRQQEVGYGFETIPALQNYFKTLISFPEEVLYKQSLMCEPNAASSGNSPAASSSEFNQSPSLSESQSTASSML